MDEALSGRLAEMPATVVGLVYSFTPFCSKHQLVPLHLLPFHAEFHGFVLTELPSLSRARADRFVRAVHMIERAIGLVGVPALGRTELTLHEVEIVRMCKQMAVVCPCRPPFQFFVAGGFIVSEVFGFGQWGDIDVWFQPACYKGSAWTVPQRKSPWPVQVMAVNDPQAHIACFDLHVCQCAIQCQVLQGRRCYELFVTPACWEAVLHRRAHMSPLHAGACRQWAVWSRVLKYEKRGLRRPARSSPPADTVAARREQTVAWRSVQHRVLAHYRSGHGACSYWIIKLQGDEVTQIRWLPEWALSPGAALRARSAEDMASSRPALAYACDFAPLMLDAAPVPFRQPRLAEKWPISFPGGALCRSDQLVPEWFLVRRHMSDGALANAVRALLHPVAHRDVYDTHFLLRCSWPADVYMVLKDWVVTVSVHQRPTDSVSWPTDNVTPTSSDGESEESASDSSYGGQGQQWGLRMDVRGHSGIRCHMFCASSGAFCTRCQHSDEELLLVFGSAAVPSLR